MVWVGYRPQPESRRERGLQKRVAARAVRGGNSTHTQRYTTTQQHNPNPKPAEAE